MFRAPSRPAVGAAMLSAALMLAPGAHAQDSAAATGPAAERRAT